MSFQIKRVYDMPEAGDGKRILVDRLWPRGVSKQRAALDEWMKDVAPSPQLREWFGHMAERFCEFGIAYRKELATDPVKQAAVAWLRQMAAGGMVSLLYAAKDPQVNHALVLKAYLEQADG